MQSDQDTFKLIPLSQTSPTHTSPTSASPPDVNVPTYTPRTVWQTPHGLPPNFNRHRHSRVTRVGKIMQRCLRLMYRFKRLSQVPPDPEAARPSPAPHPLLVLS